MGQLCELMFESFGISKFFISSAAVWSLYSIQKVSGCVLECGAAVTQIVPIWKGCPIVHACKRIDVGGNDIDKHLYDLLSKRYNKKMFDLRICRDIKEKHGYVALDYNKERAKSIDYALPNGKIIQLQDERIKCGEVLFSFLKQNSLNRQVFECINKCSTEKRASLFGNIAISGGCSKFRAVQNRMQSKLQSLCKKSKNKSVKKCKINIVADKNRHIASWRGGSIIGGFPGFGNHWFTKQEYEEYGAALNEKMEKENVFYSFNEYEPREIDFDEIQKRDKRKRKKNAKKNIKYEYTASLNPQSTDSTLAASINPGMTFQAQLGTEMTTHKRTDSDVFNSFKTINEESEEEE